MPPVIGRHTAWYKCQILLEKLVPSSVKVSVLLGDVDIRILRNVDSLALIMDDEVFSEPSKYIHQTRRRHGPEGTAARSSNRKILFTIWRPTGKTGVRLHSFLSSVPDGGTWSSSLPIRSIPGKWSLYLQNRRLGGPQVWSGHLRKENMCWPNQDTKPIHIEL